MPAEAAECIGGLKNGDGTGGTNFMASGSFMNPMDCADLVISEKHMNKKNCTGANGATQYLNGGCFCELKMNDLIDLRDGTQTCLLSGAWKNAGPNVILLGSIIGGSTCCCCCVLCAIFLLFSNEKFGQWLLNRRTPDEEEEPELEGIDLMAVAPEYWKNQNLKKAFDARHPPSPDLQSQLKHMVASTFKQVSTQDRKDKIPEKLTVVECIQVENRDLWLKYLKGKARIQAKRPGGITPVGGPTNAKSLAMQKEIMGKDNKTKKTNPFRDKSEHSVASADGECKTSSSSRKLKKHLDPSTNEYYLFHGTTPEGAFGILEDGFKLSFVGSHRGTMFGRGCYFAECSSKSDEYAASGNGELAGIYGMLVCRVACGELFRIDKSDLKTIESALATRFYDGVFGDREASVGTYREYVVFNEDVIYPEYIILYRRNYATE